MTRFVRYEYGRLYRSRREAEHAIESLYADGEISESELPEVKRKKMGRYIITLVDNSVVIPNPRRKKRRARVSPKRGRRNVRKSRRSLRAGGRKLKHIRSRSVVAANARRVARARPRRRKSVAKVARRNPSSSFEHLTDAEARKLTALGFNVVYSDARGWHVKAKSAASANRAVEYLVEVYLTGRRFAYYQDDKNLTTERGHATRFKNQYLARQKANLVRDRAPVRAEWVRVVPA